MLKEEAFFVKLLWIDSDCERHTLMSMEHKRQNYLKVVSAVDAMRSAASSAEGMFQQIQPMISPQPQPADQV